MSPDGSGHIPPQSRLHISASWPCRRLLMYLSVRQDTVLSGIGSLIPQNRLSTEAIETMKSISAACLGRRCEEDYDQTDRYALTSAAEWIHLPSPAWQM